MIKIAERPAAPHPETSSKSPLHLLMLYERSLQYPTSTARKRRVNYDALHSQQRALNHWDCVYDVVGNSDRVVCERRRNDLDRQYEIALFFSVCLVPLIFDSYKWLSNQYSYIANILCPGHTPPFRTAVIINALWRLSLLLMVSALLISYRCRQCLQKFMIRPQFGAKRLLAFRQMRYNSLRGYNFFALCDSVQLIILLATILSLSGAILLLQTLGLHVVIGALSVILLFLSLFGRRIISFLSPFNYQLSWLFSKQESEHSTWRGLNLPLPKPISLRSLVSQAQASRDWLEQDCSHFLHPNNSDAVDVLLADALVWIDSNPTIEKTPELVVLIYLCISDLELPNIFANLTYGPQVAQRGLAAIFHEVANQKPLDSYNASALASKLWLKIHIERSHVKANFHGSLEPVQFSINVVFRLLTLARNSFASGRYLVGTFEIVRLQMSDKKNAAAKDPDVQQAIFAVFDECILYFKTGKYKSHYRQAQFCVDELFDLAGAEQEHGISLPNYWAEIFGRAYDVHGFANKIMTSPDVQRFAGGHVLE